MAVSMVSNPESEQELAESHLEQELAESHLMLKNA
jgi:hypothetical protein